MTLIIEDEIRRLLEDEFSPQELVIKNESHKHVGHSGDNGTGQTHFRVEITDKLFTDYSRVQSQRMVNKAVESLFNQGLHALSLYVRSS